MSDLKEGSRCWMASVWIKTEDSKKVNTLITEVVINKIFEDGMALVTDAEDIEHYIKPTQLLRSKEEAVFMVKTGLNDWIELEIT